MNRSLDRQWAAGKLQPKSRVAIRNERGGKERVAAFLLVLSFTVFEGLPQVALAAVKLKCIGPEKRAKVFQMLERIAGNHYRSSARNLNSTRLRVVLARDENISSCTILAGRALLGGRRGVLITSIDQDMNRLLVFCENVNLQDCRIKLMAPGKTPGGLSRGAIIRRKIGEDFYAYEILNLFGSKVQAILFASDITPFLLKWESVAAD